jgi:ABC-2 type transport system ATP-binding protein
MKPDGTNASEPLVAVDRLTRRFGSKTALDDVSLTLPRGIVFGLVGANGAGKTTLIRHILGLYRAEAGSVRVFSKDPVADPAGVLARIGYVSEEHDLPSWMRVWELMRYTQAFFPTWDQAYAEELRGRFELDRETRIKDLSKGQRARADLLVALAHRPEFLVLDEPSAGLDPIVRRDILEAVIRAIADEGRTVLFSSHLLNEVQRVADQVTMIHQGKIVFSSPLDDILATHICWTLRFPEARSRPPELAGVLAWEGTGREWTAVHHGEPGEFQSAVVGLGAQVFDRRTPSLDEIFVARVGTRIAVGAEERS